MKQGAPHPHRIEIEPTDAHVVVHHDGVTLADTRRAIALREGRLPVRYYIPMQDVRMDLLTPTDTTSHCPFKGDARYWSAPAIDDVAWCYETPIPGAEPIAGLVAFYNEKVEIETA